MKSEGRDDYRFMKRGLRYGETFGVDFLSESVLCSLEFFLGCSSWDRCFLGICDFISGGERYYVSFLGLGVKEWCLYVWGVCAYVYVCLWCIYGIWACGVYVCSVFVWCVRMCCGGVFVYVYVCLWCVYGICVCGVCVVCLSIYVVCVGGMCVCIYMCVYVCDICVCGVRVCSVCLCGVCVCVWGICVCVCVFMVCVWYMCMWCVFWGVRVYTSRKVYIEGGFRFRSFVFSRFFV